MSFTRKGILQIMYKILQEELEQKVGKITYISFNSSMHSSLLAYLQGGGGGSERMKFVQ